MRAVSKATSQKMANVSLFCAICIVLIHVCQPDEIGLRVWWFHNLFAFKSAALPFFFLASGFFLAGHVADDHWLRRELGKRVRTVAVPYVMWSLIWALFVAFVAVIGRMRTDGRVLDGVRTAFDGFSFLGIDVFRMPEPAHFWYLRSLMVLVLMSPVFVWALKRCHWLVLALTFIGLFFDCTAGGGKWWYFGSRFLAIPYLFYFVVGMAARMGVVSFPRQDLTWVMVIVSASTWVALCLMKLEGLSPALTHGLVVVFEGSCLYLIWRFMPSVRLPQWATSLSFPIYVVHWFVVAGIVNRFAFPIIVTCRQWIFSATLSICGSVIAVLVLRAAFPRAARILFGGRA